MLTTDPIYKKALLPVITIKNTANVTTLYTYSSFTGTATVVTTAFPLYCSVSLSQNTHGEFTIQFDDPNEAMAATVTVGSRVIIECGKQVASIVRLISGIVRKKGYTRGSNNRILYTISGSSTGIRLNEKVSYAVSQAAKLSDGLTIDINDATRKADTLLATNLVTLTADGVLSIANLAANSDVETFIAGLSIEYGELQDTVNYIEDQSGGEVVVDTNDLVNFRYEIKNTLFGRGFTIKNSAAGQANDDADDTMYLKGKNWSYEDSYYKSDAYANKVYALLAAVPRPSTREDLGLIPTALIHSTIATTFEMAWKFRPNHAHYFPGDIYIVGGPWYGAGAGVPWNQWFRICKDSAGIPLNTAGIVANIMFAREQFPNPVETSGTDGVYELRNRQSFWDSAGLRINSFDLDTTLNYWLIGSNKGIAANRNFVWGRDSTIPSAAAGYSMSHNINFSTDANGGTNWIAYNNTKPCFGLGQYRALSFVMHDPKAIQAVSSGITAGLPTESVLSDLGTQIKTKEAIYRHMSGQLYTMARPRTVYNFPQVLAPNIPPFPGDPIVIDDTILGFSEPGNQVVLTTCGDMTYQWGNMGSGNYDAPTKLNINAIGVPTRYR